MRQLKNVLVLGGAGFIGTVLTHKLLEQGCAVRLIDRHPPAENLADPAFTSEVSDVPSSGLANEIDDRDIDAVFHLAGPATVAPSLANPAEDLHRSAMTTIGVLEAIRSTRRRPVLIYTSSAAVYGDSATVPWKEDQPLRPRSPYGIAKLATEQYVRLYADLYGSPGISARPFSVYGPGQRKLVIYDLLLRMRRGENPLRISAAPTVARDFIYVDDAAHALVALATSAPAEGESYNLSTGKATSLPDLTRMLVNAYGSKTSVEFTGTLRAGDPELMIGDPGRTAALGIQCLTPMVEGIGHTVAWFQEQAT